MQIRMGLVGPRCAGGPGHPHRHGCTGGHGRGRRHVRPGSAAPRRAPSRPVRPVHAWKATRSSMTPSSAKEDSFEARSSEPSPSHHRDRAITPYAAGLGIARGAARRGWPGSRSDRPGPAGRPGAREGGFERHPARRPRDFSRARRDHSRRRWRSPARPRSDKPEPVDGRPVPRQGRSLPPGSRIHLASTTLVLRRPETTPAAAECSGGTMRINRRPRFLPGTKAETIRFPAAPTRPEGARAPVVAAMAPLVISVGLAAVLRSPVMLLFALMSPVLLLAQWWGDRRHGRVSYRTQLAEHSGETARAEMRLAEALATESRRRHAEQPDLATAGSDRRPARRPGVGAAPRRPGPLGAPRRHGRPACRDEGGQTGRRAESPTVRGVPAVIDLKMHVVIGIAGPRPRSLCAAASLIAQTAIWHSPRTTRVVVISASATAEADWAWASRLPHTLGGDLGPLATVASTQDEAAVAARLKELGAVISARTDPSAVGGPAGPPLPSFVVVLDGTAELRRRADVASLLGAPRGIGVHVIGIDDGAERLPVECGAQLVLDDGRAPRATLHLADRTITGITPDLPHKAWFESVARSLAPLDDATPEEGARLSAQLNRVARGEPAHRRGPHGGGGPRRILVDVHRATHRRARSLR